MMRLLDIGPNAIMARSGADVAQLVEQRFLFRIVQRLIVDDCR